MSRATYSLTVAFLVDVLVRSLVASFVFAISTQAADWPTSIGLGATCAFGFFSMLAAYAFATSHRLVPINSLRLSVTMFVFFSALLLLPSDMALYVIAFSVLGLGATTGSVLLWWAHAQDTQLRTVIDRWSLLSAFSNIPMALLATLMHSNYQYLKVGAGVALGVGSITLICLQAACYRKCFRVPVVDQATTRKYATGHEPARVYDDEHHAYGAAAAAVANAAKPADTEKPAMDLPRLDEVTAREMTQFTIGGCEDDEEMKNAENDSESGQTEVSRTTRGPEEIQFRQEAAERTPALPPMAQIAVPTRRVRVKTPEHHVKQRLELWMGPWTAVVAGTQESLMYYNVTGFSSIGAPWYVTSLAVGSYTFVLAVLLAGCLRRQHDLVEYPRQLFTPYVTWYKYAIAMLVFSTLVHAVLEMSPWATQYAPHVILSLVYMPLLSMAVSLPLYRSFNICHIHDVPFQPWLPRWFLAVTVGRAIACIFEYVVLYLRIQMLAFVALCTVNIITYNAIRRSPQSVEDDEGIDTSSGGADDGAAVTSGGRLEKM